MIFLLPRHARRLVAFRQPSQRRVSLYSDDAAWYGFHRVRAPARASIQAARQVDATPTLLHRTETLINVSALLLDATSARWMCGLRSDPCKEIAAIVADRGKMHNPHTDSGGVMLGTVLEVGPGRQAAAGGTGARVGDRVVPLSSMSCIPLHLSAVKSFEHEVAFVDGTAVLAGSVPLAVLPGDLSDALCLFSLDISSLVPQVERLMAEPLPDGALPATVYVQGCGKSGVAAMAAIRRLDRTLRASRGLAPVKIVASDACPAAVACDAVQRYADVTLVADASDGLATLDLLAAAGMRGGADVVLACTTAPGCETSAVLATRPRGVAVFFSMSTSFGRAALASDIAGKDVGVRVGAGLADGMDTAMFGLLREDATLKAHFELKAAALAALLGKGGGGGAVGKGHDQLK